MGIWNSSENKAYFRMYSFSPTVYIIIVVIILECKLQLHFYSRDNRPNSTLSSVHNEILWNVFLFHPTRAALHELQCTARHTSNVTIAVFDHSKYVYIKLNKIKTMLQALCMKNRCCCTSIRRRITTSNLEPSLMLLHIILYYEAYSYYGLGIYNCENVRI